MALLTPNVRLITSAGSAYETYHMSCTECCHLLACMTVKDAKQSSVGLRVHVKVYGMSILLKETTAAVARATRRLLDQLRNHEGTSAS